MNCWKSKGESIFENLTGTCVKNWRSKIRIENRCIAGRRAPLGCFPSFRSFCSIEYDSIEYVWREWFEWSVTVLHHPSLGFFLALPLPIAGEASLLPPTHPSSPSGLSFSLSLCSLFFTFNGCQALSLSLLSLVLSLFYLSFSFFWVISLPLPFLFLCLLLSPSLFLSGMDLLSHFLQHCSAFLNASLTFSLFFRFAEGRFGTTFRSKVRPKRYRLWDPISISNRAPTAKRMQIG